MGRGSLVWMVLLAGGWMACETEPPPSVAFLPTVVGGSGVVAGAGGRAAAGGAGGAAPIAGTGTGAAGIPQAGRGAVAGSGGTIIAATGGAGAPATAGAGGAPAVGAGGMGGGSAAGTGGAAPTGPAPTFTQIYDNILSMKCAACHGSGGLNMSTKDLAHSTLVGADVAGMECTGMKRIVAGDPGMSVLVMALKAEGCRGRAGRMPPSGNPLSMEEIDQFIAWIAAGAMNN
jgi:hypothetical protein